MNLLAVDTTTDKIVVVVYRDGKIFSRVDDAQGRKHNGRVLRIIDELLDESGLEITDLNYLGVVVGPGSFTGIRIGVATINALSVATKIPIVEITALETYDDGTNKIVVLDCKHGNYYAARFINGTSSYFTITDKELNNLDCEVCYFKESNPDLIVEKCLCKVNNEIITAQAKPFYLKKSSAERD